MRSWLCCAVLHFRLLDSNSPRQVSPLATGCKDAPSHPPPPLSGPHTSTQAQLQPTIPHAHSTLSHAMQVVGEPQAHPEASKAAARLRGEWVVSIKGTLRLRKDPNPKLPTGQVRGRGQGGLQHALGWVSAWRAAGGSKRMGESSAGCVVAAGRATGAGPQPTGSLSAPCTPPPRFSVPLPAAHSCAHTLDVPWPHQVELLAQEVTVLNAVSRLLPFPISPNDEKETPREELRLKHRVLDLRRPPMASNLRMRHKLLQTCRRFLEDRHGFVVRERAWGVLGEVGCGCGGGGV